MLRGFLLVLTALPACTAAELMFHNCGESMLPVLPAEAIYLVKVDAAFADIRLGSIVQYRQRDGGQAAHLVVERVALAHGLVAWRVKGLANRYCDSDLVTPSNFIGMVDVPSICRCTHPAYHRPDPTHEFNARVKKDRSPKLLASES